jgi:hypothetical protein
MERQHKFLASRLAFLGPTAIQLRKDGTIFFGGIVLKIRSVDEIQVTMRHSQGCNLLKC